MGIRGPSSNPQGRLTRAWTNRAPHSYIDMPGFEKRWHEGDGAGKVCQVNRGECEIIICEAAARRAPLPLAG